MTREQRGVWPQLVFMVAVAALVVFVFLARPAKGADFVVVNRVPPAFVVENRVQPAGLARAGGCDCQSDPCSDARCQAYGGGGNCECKNPRAAPAFTVKPAGRPVAGRVEEATNRTYPNAPPALLGWNVTFSDGSVRFVPAAPQVMPAPGVPAAPTFHRSHSCPVCGLAQYVVERFNPDGTHTHRCARGHEWRH